MQRLNCDFRHIAVEPEHSVYVEVSPQDALGEL